MVSEFLLHWTMEKILGTMTEKVTLNRGLLSPLDHRSHLQSDIPGATPRFKVWSEMRTMISQVWEARFFGRKARQDITNKTCSSFQYEAKPVRSGVAGAGYCSHYWTTSLYWIMLTYLTLGPRKVMWKFCSLSQSANSTWQDLLSCFRSFPVWDNSLSLSKRTHSMSVRPTGDLSQFKL